MKNSQQQQADYVTSLSKYIPSLVLHQLIKRQNENRKTQLPELQEMETVCLFADISGFTKVGEACAKKGQRGNEDLAFVINRYMEGMVKNLSKYGGDIIKFVGDAMIVMWPQDKSRSREEAAQRTVRSAIQCSLDIQREMHNLTIMSDVSALQVKMGIGFGNCALLYVGGVFQRQEFFTVGTALTWALDSEGEATAGGQIIVSESAFQWVREFYDATEIIKFDAKSGKQLGRFYHIHKLTGEGIKADAMSAKLVADIPQDQMIRLKNVLEGFLAKSILNYLKIGMENFGSETRSLTVMFVSLGIELSSAETPRGMNTIQEVVVTVQEQVYRQKGSINKLMMDDKGSTLICLWGLTPMCNEDDAARAILCAYNMRKALMDKYQIKLSIGISSGEVFAGVCGTSGSRKEFTSLGDVVNLAARVMYWPKSKGIMGKIHTDLNTRNLATNFFSFVCKGHHEFKGKSISLPVYEPQFEIPGDLPYEQTLPRSMQEASMEMERLMNQNISGSQQLAWNPQKSMEQYMKVHGNPMVLDPENKPSELLACDNIIKEQAVAIRNYFNEDFEDINKPFLLAIRGEIGSGKTLFVRNYVETILNLKQHFNFYNKGDQSHFSLFFSSLNTETSYRWLNAFRPILAQMFTFQCCRDKITGYDLLRLLLDCADDGGHYDKWNCMAKIFDLDVAVPEEYQDLQQLKPEKQNFVTPEIYSEDDSEDMQEILLEFMQLVFGQYNNISEDLREEYFSRFDKKKQEDQEMCDMPPFTIVLDSSYLIDEVSWNFLEKICNECIRVGIIICLQTDTMDKLRISETNLKTFGSVWQSSGLSHLKQIDLPSFDAITLQQVLVTFSSEYQRSFKFELKNMTDITVENSIKTKEQGLEWIEHFTNLWQLHCTFASVDDKIIRAMVQKCRGNPLVSLQYFVNLLQNRFIRIQDTHKNGKHGKVVATDLFLKCEQLNDFTAVPLPRVAVKINCCFIDMYIQDIQMKKKIRQGEIEQAMRGLVILKAASVIGEEFELLTLAKIQPLRSESLSGLKSLLRILEEHDFIEFLDESDSKNAKCRFNKTFLRETMYQIILYRDQKQFLHGAIGSHLSEQAPKFKHGSDPDKQINILKHHLLLNQDQKNEHELTSQARAGLVIRRITYRLALNPQGIAFKGQIIKQGPGANARAEEKLVIVTTQWLRWFHDEDSYNQGEFDGSIPLKFIYAAVPARMNTGNKNGFAVSTASWYSGNSDKEQDITDFYFAPDSATLRDEWIAAIEFLRTKAIYENFARQNCAVSFPLKMKTEEQVQEEKGIDKGELLFDFGTKFKQKLVIPHTNLNKSVINKNDEINSNRGGRKLGSARGRSQIGGATKNVETLAAELKLMYNASMVTFLNHLNLTSVKDSIKSQNASIGAMPQNQDLSQTIRTKLTEAEQYYDDNSSSIYDLKRKSRTDSSLNNLKELSVKEEPQESVGVLEAKRPRDRGQQMRKINPMEIKKSQSHEVQGDDAIKTKTNKSETTQQPEVEENKMMKVVENKMMSQLENIIQQHLSKGLNEIKVQQQDMFAKQQDELAKSINQTQAEIFNMSMNSQNQSSNMLQNKKKQAAGMTSLRKRDDFEVPLSKAPDSEPEDEEGYQSQSYNMIMKEDSQTTIEMKQMYSENEVVRKQQGFPPTNRNSQHYRKQTVNISPDSHLSAELKSDFTVKRQYQMGENQFSPHDRRVMEQVNRNYHQRIQNVPVEHRQIRAISSQDLYQEKPQLRNQSSNSPLNMSVGPPQAIALADCSCTTHDQVMNIPKGATVDVIAQMPNPQMYRIRYRDMTGVFRMRDFTRKIEAQSVGGLVEDNTLDHLSPIHGHGQDESFHNNFYQERIEMKLQKLSQDASKRYMQEDEMMELNQQSLKNYERQKKKAQRQRQKQLKN